MITVAGKKVICAEAATFGTESLAKNAYKSTGDKYNSFQTILLPLVKYDQGLKYNQLNNKNPLYNRG